MKIEAIIFLVFMSITDLHSQKPQGIGEFSIEGAQEFVHVNFNESYLLSGEYFYYKFTCLNAKNKTRSTLSEIGYLELVSEEGTLVFKHKIKLESGLGYGDFFVPTTVKSGRYKLLGYTNWMKNWGQDSFFQADIMIINPYTSNQSGVLNDKLDTTAPPKSSYQKVAVSGQIKKKPFPIRFSIDKKTFGKREHVQLRIKENTNKKITGNFSVSVRNANSYIEQENRIDDKTDFWDIDFPSSKPQKVNALPELRGELIRGIVKQRENGQPVQNMKVLITVPGSQYDIRAVTTNDIGEFFANIDDKSQSDKVFVQIMGNDPQKYQIVLDNQEGIINQAALHFGAYKLSENASRTILERSIQNQIENAYFSVKPDTLLLSSIELPFYGNLGKQYILDEYTRFSTIEEIALEILDRTWLSKKNGNLEFALRSANGETIAQEYGSLLIVDGIPVLDQEKFIQNYDAYKIERITVVSDQYRIGNSIFDGIVDVKTEKLDFLNTKLESQEGFSFLRPVNSKNYFKQTYPTRAYNSRVPDQRNQLLWLPNVFYKGEEIGIDFYTSDVPGEFSIILEGFSDDGTFLYSEETIRVN